MECEAESTYLLKGGLYLGRQPGEEHDAGHGARVVKCKKQPEPEVVELSPQIIPSHLSLWLKTAN